MVVSKRKKKRKKIMAHPRCPWFARVPPASRFPILTSRPTSHSQWVGSWWLLLMVMWLWQVVLGMLGPGQTRTGLVAEGRCSARQNESPLGESQIYYIILHNEKMLNISWQKHKGQNPSHWGYCIEYYRYWPVPKTKDLFPWITWIQGSPCR